MQLFQIISSLIVFSIVAGLAFLYARRLGNLVSYSSRVNIEIHGTKYRSVTQLYADIGFLNALFSGIALEGATDQTQKKILHSLRKLPLTQLSLWLVLFFSFLLVSFVRIAQGF